VVRDTGRGHAYLMPVQMQRVCRCLPPCPCACDSGLFLYHVLLQRSVCELLRHTCAAAQQAAAAEWPRTMLMATDHAHGHRTLLMGRTSRSAHRTQAHQACLPQPPSPAAVFGQHGMHAAACGCGGKSTRVRTSRVKREACRAHGGNSGQCGGEAACRYAPEGARLQQGMQWGSMDMDESIHVIWYLKCAQ
jgi:hypothetical protein